MVLFKVSNVISGAGAEATKQDEGASLLTVLETPALRVELALLILLCTDAMRNDLVATFDPNKTHETTSSTAPPPQSPKPRASPAQDLISFDAPRDEALDPAEAARRIREQEIESSQMQGLRRSALTFFDKWRAGVMHRACDVLCVRGEVVRQAKQKRKRDMDQNAKARQGNSLLIDFEGDPFGAQDQATGVKKHGRYEVIVSKITEFEEEKRVLILHCILLLLLSLEHYPAHSRVLLLHLAGSLGIEVDTLAEHEKSVAQGLLASAASQMDAEESAKKQAASDSAASKWKIGLAAVGGAVLIGVTGGLAAPLLAAGVGTVMGGLGLGAISGLLGTLAGSSVLVGSLFGAYGGKMTGRIMKQYAREVQDFEFIPIQDPGRPSAQRSREWAEEQDARDPTKREQHRLRVSIGVSGWLNSPSDVNKPWDVIDTTGTEPFSLRFELDAMLRMGNSLNDVLFSYAWDGVTYTIVSRTLLGALYAGLWPLGLVKVASVLDNPFSVAVARADKAGKVLARALMDKVQGERPVTLMGYSIGARVIYSCLVELAEQNAFGLVESVILMGAPVPSDSWSWRQIRSVVAARVVNVYSTEDYILGFLYRSTKLQMGVAGLQPVEGIFGIENVDMSKLVTGHDRYRFLVGTILTKVGFGDVESHRVAEQERALEIMEKKKEQVREHVKQHKKDTQQPDPSSQGATEMIVVPGRKPVPHAEATRAAAPSEPTPSLPARRPIIQNNTHQQPQIQRHTSIPNPSTPSAADMDPLSGSIPTTSSTPRSEFPVASLSRHSQVPSNMVPTPAAPPRSPQPPHSAFNDDDHKIQMRDIDSQKFSPPLEEMLRSSPALAPTPKVVRQNERGLSGSAVAATAGVAGTGAVVGGTAAVVAERGEPERERESEVDGGHDEQDDVEDEVSSEFGELSMVEPTPLEEGDFGLM